ncbi:hypothetical protein COL60_15725 [Bacillus pseudomycoides]|uniref:Group-specific protein n=2 Tax=Bacillus pseudomycoides TaxID=64104 RepID=A0A2C3UYC9_9BACI|nr:hypothetical protein CON79_15605 [Bacillus pseudomycoides]PEA84796.1 hypothetical protein CON99_04315 [Bacillus pseudomycoides]PED72217.1 hypothetical protein CON97_09880 [Bacillus pseudomycoides]PEI40779.1 hypothetical protein CN620_14170 [Bacillus pseudomycoides]PEJ79012.1 hypothetical protein CN680_11340 [Bacillus pseudomycoides]
MIHMENVYKGLSRMGYTAMFIFGGVFLLRFLIHDELLLDQLIGFSAGMVMFISSFLIQQYSKELQMNKEY